MTVGICSLLQTSGACFISLHFFVVQGLLYGLAWAPWVLFPVIFFTFFNGGDELNKKSVVYEAYDVIICRFRISVPRLVLYIFLRKHL